MLVAKLADTLMSEFIVTVHVAPVPPHAPPQPPKLWPLAGVAVRLTCVPPAKLALHVAGQLMPAGELVTVPLPLSLTVIVAVLGTKVAVAPRVAFSLTVQLAVPLHAPLQPPKCQPPAGVAVRL